MKTFIDTDTEFICDIQAPCFQMLTNEEAEVVRSSKTQVLFRKGENLTKQGAFASYVLFIMKGYAKQYVEGNGKYNHNLRINKPGEFVGLSSVFGRNTFNYSCVALTDTQVFVIEKDALAGISQQNGQFAYTIIRRYCEQNSTLFDSIRNLVYKQMNGRIADALLYLSPENFEGEDIISMLSRKEIAEFAGLTSESTVKVLKNFEKDGLIKLDDKHIEVVDSSRLAEISKNG
ncbi:MAG: Crp/Fnr family transcriptional regulator [Prolixibacteraceae bacterium]